MHDAYSFVCTGLCAFLIILMRVSTNNRGTAARCKQLETALYAKFSDRHLTLVVSFELTLVGSFENFSAVSIKRLIQSATK